MSIKGGSEARNTRSGLFENTRKTRARAIKRKLDTQRRRRELAARSSGIHLGRDLLTTLYEDDVSDEGLEDSSSADSHSTVIS
jgi:hypothetical protein